MEKAIIIKDPIYPDLDKWNLEKFKEEVKEYGILNINFLFEEGVEIEYDKEIITPSYWVEGIRMFSKSGYSPDPYIVFNYGNEGKDFSTLELVKFFPREVISSIPLYNCIDFWF